jgi:hypothetical protein
MFACPFLKLNEICILENKGGARPCISALEQVLLPLNTRKSPSPSQGRPLHVRPFRDG